MYCLQKSETSIFGFAQKLINNGNSTKIASSSRLLLVAYHVKQNIMSEIVKYNSEITGLQVSAMDKLNELNVLISKTNLEKENKLINFMIWIF